VLILIIGLFAGTGAILAHEDDELSNGEDTSEGEGTWHCHQEGHDDYHHRGSHHHEDDSTSGGFISLIRRLFHRH